MNTTRQEKTIKQLFLNECWEYLRNNFHKFNENHKIKIALTLAQKDLPQEIQGMTSQQIVIMNDIIKNGKPLRYNLGQTSNAGDAEDPGQARSDSDES